MFALNSNFYGKTKVHFQGSPILVIDSWTRPSRKTALNFRIGPGVFCDLLIEDEHVDGLGVDGVLCLGDWLTWLRGSEG